VSRSGSDCAHPVYGSVAAWKSWLTSVAEQAAEQAKYDAPFWVKTGVSDPPPDAAVPGVQGSKCSVSADCSSAFACFSPTSMASDAYCAAFCQAPTECPAGTTCQGGVNVCVLSAPQAAAAAHGSSSCAVSAVGSVAPKASAALLILFVLAGRRRRRPRAAGANRKHKMSFGTGGPKTT
jgi:MYXO-CTERM domain-containing protein